MLKYLIDIMNRLSIPKECHKPIIKTYIEMPKEDIDMVLCQYEDENVEYMSILNNWRVIETKNHIKRYIGDLIFVLLMCQTLEKIYEKKGLSKDLFIETMKDITYKVDECKLVKKEIGTFVAEWFTEFFRLRLFKLGRLQYELAHFGFTYKDDKYDLNPYMRCVNVHIPRTGERLNPDDVDKSIDLAAKFFRPLFDNKPVLFRIDSWLLYSKTLEFSTPESNLYKFGARFIKFKEIDDPDISEMWRLFDDSMDDLSRLKANSSLRKKYLKHLVNGGKIGVGFGFFYK